MNELTNITETSLPQSLEAKIVLAISYKKQLEQYESEFRDILLKEMNARGIKQIKTDMVTVTAAERVSYSISDTDKVDKSLLKQVLDTSKVSSHVKLYGEVPSGVDKKTTDYLLWRAKKEAD